VWTPFGIHANAACQTDLEFGDTKYSLNYDFKQEAIQIADELELDEVEAAKLLLVAQGDAADLDRTPIVSAIIRFHKKRQFLLDCLRLALQIPINELESAEVAAQLTAFKHDILQYGNGQVDGGSKYWQKCLTAMGDVEAWLHRLADRSQRASLLSPEQTFSPAALEIIELEHESLLNQHESLAAIASLLIKDNFTFEDDFRNLLSKVRRLERHDLILVHYLPVLMNCIAKFGPENCTPEQARKINEIINMENESEAWGLRSFHAATYVWWSAEYFSRHKAEESDAKEQEELPRFEKALQDGAFHFMLSILQDVRRDEWYDPAKAALTTFLLQDTSTLQSETPRPARYFQAIMAEQFQTFVESFIANMPNTLRTLKTEEDNARRELLARFQKNTSEYQYHLERFLVLLAYAFERDPEAAATIWDESDGNIYGFLQWAAKRQTTPRVAAFCEMLRAISEDERSANAAHQFLLEEGSPIAGKLRRTGSLSWSQIFGELEFYASTIRNSPIAVHSGSYAANQVSTDQVVEPESAIMLECYLRLVSHLCRQSSVAREWVLTRDAALPSLPLILYDLCKSNIDSRLRACAFNTLGSLLTCKTAQLGNDMWIQLDQWICGAASSSSLVRPVGSPAWSEQMIFDTISTGFEEATAFVGFLNALVAPYIAEAGLNDALPFPENLGAAYRMPGIDSYVDFAVGKVFGEKWVQIGDLIQLRILRLNCLDFIATCLSTFNEDLVVVANKSSFPVESAMRSSSLKAYVTLHPFARVMEWLFNVKVLDSLFATVHQNIDEVNAAASDSPFILSLVRSVEVMNMMMKLQATYLDIIRPVVKAQTTRKNPVPHSAIATFEDAMLNNLPIVVDLGLYCGTGHQDLTLASLSLLEKLSSARKLVVNPSSGFGKYSDRSKLIGVFEGEGEAERISRSLTAQLGLDERELEARQTSPGYVIKSNVLSFIKNCLVALPDRPTVAHLLLGFVCHANDIEISDDGLFAQGTSLFHAVLSLALNYPEVGLVPWQDQHPGEDGQDVATHPNVGQLTYFAWLSNIKEACTEILKILWKSPLSCALVMTELRSSDYIFLQAVKQTIVGPSTLWDGFNTCDPEFLFSDSALALRNFLLQRAAFYDYVAREFRVAVKERMSALRSRLQATLLGSTTFPGEPACANPNIFDLFDFMELEIGGLLGLPSFNLLGSLDFEICRRKGPGTSSPYDLPAAHELIQLRRNEILKSGQLLEGGSNIIVFEEEAQVALHSLLAINQQEELVRAHAETLRQWTQLAIVAVTSCDFDDANRTTFVLQIFQLVVPKLERAFVEGEGNALVLLQLIQPLMRYVDPTSSAPKAKSVDFGNDRVFQIFRVCLNGIFSSVATAELREICYQICFHFLQSTSKAGKNGSQGGKHTLRSIKVAGDRLMDVLCDDAYSGQGSCRVSALLFLDALVLLTNQEESKYMIETFDRVNFVGVLVDSIKQMPVDLRASSPGGTHPDLLGPLRPTTNSGAEVPGILAFYNAALALLLRVAQTRLGATHVINAGLFQSVRDSHLFSADPDIGLGRLPSKSLISIRSQLITTRRDGEPRRLAKILRSNAGCAPRNQCRPLEPRPSKRPNRQVRAGLSGGEQEQHCRGFQAPCKRGWHKSGWRNRSGRFD
jgi:nuclear pore complex protein Nup205